MGPRPWRPADELDSALDRGELSFAITLAGELAEDRGRPIDLATALRFLPLVIAQRPGEYDGWARRWLARWLREAPATMEAAAEVAGSLADLPSEPSALETIERALP